MLYLWLKAFHLIALVCWFAGLFYLPRLFVYHAQSSDTVSHERFCLMERKLYRGIMLPAMILTLVPELLRVSAQWSMVFYGCFLLLYVYLFRDGLLPILKSAVSRITGQTAQASATQRVARLMAETQAAPDTSPAHELLRPIISLSDVSCRFGALTVLQGLDWSIQNGCINGLIGLIGLIGPNGAGKTTFINLLTGVVPPTLGEVFLGGETVTHLSQERRVAKGLARTFQINTLFPGLSVIEAVVLAILERKGLGGRWFRSVRDHGAEIEEARALLADLHLEAQAETTIGVLASGSRRAGRRCGIAESSLRV